MDGEEQRESSRDVSDGKRRRARVDREREDGESVCKRGVRERTISIRGEQMVQGKRRASNIFGGVLYRIL